VETKHGPGCLAVTGYQMKEFADDHSCGFAWWRLRTAPKWRDRRGGFWPAKTRRPSNIASSTKTGRCDGEKHFRSHRDERGALVSYDGLIQDITGAQAAEEALRESDVRYRTLFAESADGILIADIETKTFNT